MNVQVTLSLLLLVIMLLLLLTRRIGLGRSRMGLRPLPGYQKLEGQVGQAIESGQHLYVTLGQGSLVGPVAITSIAAGKFLDALAKDSCANDTPPLVTVGEATLLPYAENMVRGAYEAADRLPQYHANAVQFVAHETDRYAYATGAASQIRQHEVLSSIMAGRFGAELMLMAATANRQNVAQVIGTDDPVALAVAAATTDQIIIGEELLASGAYLEGHPSQIASLQVQDILRWVLALFLIGYALFQAITGS